MQVALVRAALAHKSLANGDCLLSKISKKAEVIAVMRLVLFGFHAGFGPDGMCLSKQGNIWTAMPQGGKIMAYSKKTGEPVNQVSWLLYILQMCLYGHSFYARCMDSKFCVCPPCWLVFESFELRWIVRSNVSKFYAL